MADEELPPVKVHSRACLAAYNRTGDNRPCTCLVVRGSDQDEEAARVAARDARIKAYRARERERFVRALDRFLDAMIATDVPVGGDHADATAKSYLFGVDAGPAWKHGAACSWPDVDCVGHAERPHIECSDPTCEIPEHRPTLPIAPAYWDRARETSPMDAVGIHQKAGYGVPGCDCPLPEKVSESCPIHGTRPMPSGVQGGSWVNDETGVPGNYTVYGVPRCVASLHVPSQDPDARCFVCGAPGFVRAFEESPDAHRDPDYVYAHRNPDYVVQRCEICGAGPFALAATLAGHRAERHGRSPLPDESPCPYAYWYNGPAGQWEWEPAEWLNLDGRPGRMCKLSGPHAAHVPGDVFIGPDDDDPRASQG